MLKLISTTPLAILLCISLSISNQSFAKDNKEKADKASLPIEQFSILAQVFHQIRYHYVSEVSDEQLMDYAIKGMLENLDPHSAYLDQKEHQELKENTTGEFAGIGVEISLEYDKIVVIAPIDNSPAKKAGILAGDEITQVGAIKVNSSNIEQAVESMRGPKGSIIKLVIKRKKSSVPLTFNIKRDIIKLQSITSQFISPGYAYLRISQFRTNSSDDATVQLKKIADTKRTEGLIIDLRNNPGGALTAAIDIADLLLPKGLIVYTQGRDENTREDYHSTAFQLLASTKIVVLINGGSASASEILAGALQDRERALIVGTQSFGKGSVQTILPLPNKKGMKLTTARYYTPAGRSIQAEGISPDIVMEDGTFEAFDHSNQLTEADLNNHLGKTDIPKTLHDTHELLQDDYQLQQALNILKAMRFANTPGGNKP